MPVGVGNGNYAPLGWAFCNGQLLAIAEYEALFNLIGTTYGGDGQTTFALPNSRVASRSTRAPVTPYARLGFVRTGATEVHEAMEWRG